MAEDTNELSVPIGADPSGLREGFQEAERIVQTGVSRIESSLGNLRNIGQQLAGLGAALTASITLPIVALAKESVQAYGDLQSLELGLEAVAGSAIYAGKQLGNLREIAKLPGLGLKEAVKGSINLQAIGYSAASSEKILSQFGNAVASVGKGRVEFERAIYGVTQLANTEFPLGEDLNIIKDALPQVSTLLKAAFGTSRTEDLQKLKVSSKQVMDVILTGLEKLPRVNGGIKNAFENLGDSIQQNLARIGKILDDNLDISGLIDKLTGFLDKLISKFENLSPEVQQFILIITALAASIGPLLLGLGGILIILPNIVEGFKILKAAVISFNQALLANPYTAIAVALAAIAVAVTAYYVTLETAKDRQDRLNESLVKAGVLAKKETEELKKNYEISQDVNASLEDRNKAVDQIQKQYPAYFGNLSNEAILAGKAGNAYKQLALDISKASYARAAQSELDKRNETRLQEDIDLQNKLTQSVKDYNNAQDRTISTENGEIFISGETARKAALGRNKKFLQDRRDLRSAREKEDAFLIQTIKKGQEAITKLDAPGVDNFLPGLEKTKKETEKQIAEIFPKGSIAELRQRAELLKKAIETSVDGIVKVRGLDKFGKDKNKKGNPYFTGEILSLEEALNRLEDLGIRAGDIEIQPIKFNQKGLLDQFGQEYKTFNDFMLGEVQRTGKILTEDLPGFIDKAAMEALTAEVRLEEALQEVNKSLTNIINSQVVDGISDAFASIGKSLATGSDLFKSLGQSLLSSFGKILSELGKQMIQYGVGLLAIKIAMKSLNPYVAIAAGAALVALGAGISATVSKQSESIGGNSSGVSSASGVPSSNFSNSTVSNGGSGAGEYVFRLSGPDLIAVFNRNVSAQDKVTAG